MTITRQILLSPQSDNDSMVAEPLAVPSAEVPGERRALLAHPEIVEKWKRKFTFGLRSEAAANA